MENFISIDTATSLCSVSVFNNEKLLATKETDKKNSHSSLITIFIKEALAEANLKVSDLNYIAISSGPGSYTGLRIGASAAKALAYSLNKPLISFNTLENMVEGLKHTNKTAELYIAAIDARRDEVYLTIIDKNEKKILESKNIVLKEGMFNNVLANKKVLICGDGAAKFIKYHNIKHIKNDQSVNSSSKYCIKLVSKSIDNQEFVKISDFEPNYIKHFYTTPRISK